MLLNRFIPHILLYLMLTLLASCSGGGGTTQQNTSNTVNTILGNANLGIVKQAAVRIQKLQNGKAGVDLTSPLTTDSYGNFQIPLDAIDSAYQGAVILMLYDPYQQATYFNEFSGKNLAFPVGASFRSILPQLGTQPIAITALTEVATQLALDDINNKKLTPTTAITQANQSVGQAFLGGISPVHTIATDISKAVNSSTEAQVYARILAGIAFVSQINNTDIYTQSQQYAQQLIAQDSAQISKSMQDILTGISTLTSAAPANVFMPANTNATKPVALDASLQLVEDSYANIVLKGLDLNQYPIVFNIVSQPKHGSLLGTAPNLVYTPAANYNGQDGFTFHVDNGFGQSAVATVSLNITPVNDAPVANTVVLLTKENQLLTGNMVANDVDGDALTFAVVSQPIKGTLTVTNAKTGAFSYVPNSNVSGTDTFTFKASDAVSSSNVATATINIQNINNAPVAQAQSVTLAEDTYAQVTLVATDADNNPLTYHISVQPAHGKISGTPPAITYTPNPNFNGVDTFSFYAFDGALKSLEEVVTLNVTPVNDAPVVKPTIIFVQEGGSVTDFLSATDVDGDTLTYNIIRPAVYGITTILDPATGSFLYDERNILAGGLGTDTVTFEVSDGKVATQGVLTVSIQHINHLPVADNYSATFPEDNSANITLTAFDPDYDLLHYSITMLPKFGQITGTPPNITYTPNPNYYGTDTFKFVAFDGTGNSNEALVSLNITPVNDAPIAKNQTLSLNQGKSIGFLITGSDAENDPLTYQITSSVQAGNTLAGNLSGTVTGMSAIQFIPAVDFYGQDQISFTLTDSHGAASQATISFQVLPFAQSVQDTDGDGLRDIDEVKYGTNPTLVDTDGDGFSDFEEIVTQAFDPKVDNFRFNPLIADTPKIKIEVTSAPDFALNYELTDGTLQSFSTTRGSSTAQTVTTVTSNENTTANEVSHSFGLEIAAEVSKEPSLTTTVSYQLDTSMSQESTVSFSTENSTENATTFEQGQALETSKEVAVADGDISVTVQIRNTGNLSYTLNNLFLSAFSINNGTNGQEIVPIGQMAFTDAQLTAFPNFTLAPGQTTTHLNFTAAGVDIATMKDLMKNSLGFTIKPAVFNLLDSNGLSYSFNATSIASKDALFIVDYGGEQGKTNREESIAVHGSSAQNITMLDAIQRVMNLPMTMVDVYGNVISDQYGNITGTGYVQSIGGVSSITSGVVDLGSWMIIHGQKQPDGTTKTKVYVSPNTQAAWQNKSSIQVSNLVSDFNPSNIQVNAGDVLHLMYIRDDDQDGLSNYQEFLYQSNPLAQDTDGDGLLDYEEIKGWTVSYTDQFGNVQTKQVFSNLTKFDTDGDGFSDGTEIIGAATAFLRRDPSSKDTDGDGILDSVDDFSAGRFAANAYDSMDISNLNVALNVAGTAYQFNFTSPNILSTPSSGITSYEVVRIYKAYSSTQNQAFPALDSLPANNWKLQVGNTLSCANAAPADDPNCVWVVDDVVVPTVGGVVYSKTNVAHAPVGGVEKYRYLEVINGKYKLIPDELLIAPATDIIEITMKPGRYTKNTTKGLHGNFKARNATSHIVGEWLLNDNPITKGIYKTKEYIAKNIFGHELVTYQQYDYIAPNYPLKNPPTFTQDVRVFDIFANAWTPVQGEFRTDFVYAGWNDWNDFLNNQSGIGDGQLDLIFSLSFDNGFMFTPKTDVIDGSYQAEKTSTTVSGATTFTPTGGTPTDIFTQYGVLQKSVAQAQSGLSGECHYIAYALTEQETLNARIHFTPAYLGNDTFNVKLCPSSNSNPATGNVIWDVWKFDNIQRHYVLQRPLLKNSTNVARFPISTEFLGNGLGTLNATVDTVMEIRIK